MVKTGPTAAEDLGEGSYFFVLVSLLRMNSEIFVAIIPVI